MAGQVRAGSAPPRPVRSPALVVGTLLTGVLIAGCGSVIPGQARVAPVSATDRALIDTYVTASNRAGDAGPSVQASFLRATQAQGAPFPPARCFSDLTMQTDLVARTLRPDPGWRPPTAPPDSAPPAGAIYVAAAGVSVRRGLTEVREDVGSKHFVIHDGHVSGYAPCVD